MHVTHLDDHALARSSCVSGYGVRVLSGPEPPPDGGAALAGGALFYVRVLFGPEPPPQGGAAPNGGPACYITTRGVLDSVMHHKACRNPFWLQRSRPVRPRTPPHGRATLRAASVLPWDWHAWRPI